MPATIAPHQPDEDFINKSLLASLDAQADAEPLSSSEESDHPIAASYGSNSNTSSSDSPLDNPSHNPYHNMRNQESIYFHQTQNGLYTAANHATNIHKHNEYPDEYESNNGFPNNNYRNSFTSYPNTTRIRQHQSALNSGGPFRDSATYYPSAGNEIYPGQMTSPVQSHMQAYDPRASYDYTNGHQGNAHKAYEQYGVTPSSLIQQSHHNPGKPTHQQSQQQPLSGYPPSTQYSNGVQLSSQTPYGPHVPAGVAMSGPANPAMPPGLTGPGSLNIANGTNTAANGEEISTIFVVGFPEDMQEREFQNMFTFSPGFEAATLKIPNKEYTAYGGVLGAAPGSALVNGVNGLRGPTFQTYGGQNDPYNLVTVNQGGVVVDGGRDGTMTAWPASAPLADDLSSSQHFLASAGLGGINSLAAAAAGAAANANLPPRKQIIGFAKFRSREEALVARDVLQGRRVDIEKGAVLKAEMAKKNLHTKRGVGPVPGVNVGPGPPAAGAMIGATLQQQQNPTSSVQQQQNVNGIGLDAFVNGADSAFPTREHRESIGLPALARLGWRDSMGLPSPQQLQSLSDGANESTPTLNGISNDATPKAGPAGDEERRRDSVATALGSYSLGGSSSIGPTSSSGSITGGSATSGSTLRGPRERMEEEERRRKEKDQKEREKEKEREMNLMRLRASNSAAFDAFHSVNTNVTASGPPSTTSVISATGLSRQSSSTASQSGASSGGTNSALLTPSSTAPTTESLAGSSPMIPGAEPQQHFQQQLNQQDVVGPWDRINPAVPVGRASSESQRSISPPPPHQQYRTPSESSQTSDIGTGASQNGVNPLGHIGGGLNGNGGEHGRGGLALDSLKLLEQHHLQHRLQQEQQQQLSQQPMNGTASGATTTSSGNNGNTSPTLPSPASGNSSGSASTTSASLRGTVDQNPPINTLYVGNLPTSPPPMGYQADYLEDTLREVFAQRPGYRKLCFRHKAAGPMCFVEFEDVQFASKALAEMSGHTLGGAVKNGIRLSYSKNPLGVRTPTSAGGSNSGGPTLQQQQQLMQTLSHAQYHQRHGGGGSDSFQTRLADEFTNGGGHPQHARGAIVPPTSILRRDSTMSPTTLQGPQSFGNGNNNPNSFLSSPPPRFYSTSPGMPFTSSTPLTSTSSAFIPRSAANGVSQLGGMFGGNNTGGYASPPPSFTPFGAFAPGGEGPFGHPQQHYQHSIPNEQQQHHDD